MEGQGPESPYPYDRLRAFIMRHAETPEERRDALAALDACMD